MAKDFYTDIDLKGNQVKNVRIDNAAEYPGDPGVGQMVFFGGLPRWWDGANWITLAAAGQFQGGFDADSSALPTVASAGDWWFVTEEGDALGGLSDDVRPGDVIAANTDNPTGEGDLTVVRIIREQVTLTEEEKQELQDKTQHLTTDGKLDNDHVEGLGELALLDEIGKEKVTGLEATLDDHGDRITDIENDTEQQIIDKIEELRPDEDYKNPNFPALVSELTTKVDTLEGLVDSLNNDLTAAIARIDALEAE